MSLSEKIANAESSDWLCKGISDEEVIKIISEAKEQAREQIKLIDTLNKIQAEIDESYENYEYGYSKGLVLARQIIDKYIKEVKNKE